MVRAVAGATTASWNDRLPAAKPTGAVCVTSPPRSCVDGETVASLAPAASAASSSAASSPPATAAPPVMVSVYVPLAPVASDAGPSSFTVGVAPPEWQRLQNDPDLPEAPLMPLSCARAPAPMAASATQKTSTSRVRMRQAYGEWRRSPIYRVLNDRFLIGNCRRAERRRSGAGYLVGIAFCQRCTYAIIASPMCASTQPTPSSSIAARRMDVVELGRVFERVELVAIAAQEGEAVEIARVRLQHDLLEALDAPVRLLLRPELIGRVEQLQGLRLAPRHSPIPTDEQRRVRHVEPPIKG